MVQQLDPIMIRKSKIFIFGLIEDGERACGQQYIFPGFRCPLTYKAFPSHFYLKVVLIHCYSPFEMDIRMWLKERVGLICTLATMENHKFTDPALVVSLILPSFINILLTMWPHRRCCCVDGGALGCKESTQGTSLWTLLDASCVRRRKSKCRNNQSQTQVSQKKMTSLKNSLRKVQFLHTSKHCYFLMIKLLKMILQ